MQTRSSHSYIMMGQAKFLCYMGEAIKVLTKANKPTKKYLNAFKNCKGEVPYYNSEFSQLIYRVGGEHVDERTIVKRDDYLQYGTLHLLKKWDESNLIVAVNEAGNLMIADKVERLFDDDFD